MSAQHPGITGKGLTYDDVLLFPAFSEVMQPEDDLSAPFCRNINQKIPGVSEGVGDIGSRNIVALRYAGITSKTRSGITESNPHVKTVTSEAQNYSR